MQNSYGQPFALASFEPGIVAQGLERITFARSRSPEIAYNEAWLQDLIARHPEILPIEAIEPSLRDARSICTELPTPAGYYIDNLFATDRGDFIVVECKLWRNPEARRAVVAQILEYAKELSRWDYEKLNAAIKRALPAPGIESAASLYERARSPDGLDEANFIDAVSRNLRRGRFLLLIVGDGIQEGVQSMADFMQQHAALHFTLGLVELAIFSIPNGGHIVQPRVLSQTTMIERGVVELNDERMQPRLNSIPNNVVIPSISARPLPAAKSITEEIFYEDLERWRSGSAMEFRAFIKQLGETGVTTELLPASMKLIGRSNDAAWSLGTISAKEGTVWLDYVLSRANAVGRRDAALEYYRQLASLIDDETIRLSKLNPSSKSGITGIPVSALLDHPEAAIAAMEAYLRSVSEGTP